MPSNLLVVDAGNTNIVLGVYRDDTLVDSWQLATARERTADEYGINARLLIGEILDGPLEGAIVSSVVPPLNGVLAAMIEKYFGVQPLFVEPGVKTGIAIQVDNPQEVGADRIVNCVAAHDRWGGPTIVVDFGTATTFDLVTADAKYAGGVIAPGLTVSAEALFAVQRGCRASISSARLTSSARTRWSTCSRASTSATSVSSTESSSA